MMRVRTIRTRTAITAPIAPRLAVKVFLDTASEVGTSSANTTGSLNRLEA